MRTIGAKNIDLVKTITREEYPKGPYETLSDRVYNRIPQAVFDIWEMAYQEIDRIIFDTISDIRGNDFKA